jgi:hypothetical protein
MLDFITNGKKKLHHKQVTKRCSGLNHIPKSCMVLGMSSGICNWTFITRACCFGSHKS